MSTKLSAFQHDEIDSDVEMPPEVKHGSESSEFDPGSDMEDEDEEDDLIEEGEDILEEDDIIIDTSLFQDEESVDEDELGLQSKWPVMKLAFLDRRIPAKVKKGDYEPVGANAIFSCLTSTKADVKESDNHDLHLTEPELDEWLSYLLHYGSNSLDMYRYIKNEIAAKKSDIQITLPELREISPDTPLLFLSTVLQILNRQTDQDFKKDVSSLQITSVFEERYSKPSLDSMQCQMCSKNCTIVRYSYLFATFVICSGCFQTGNFPSRFSSNSFQCMFGAVTSKQIKPSQISEWTPNDKLALLEAVEAGFSAENLPEKTGKPKFECIYHFATIPIKHLVSESMGDLEKLIGTSTNPVISLSNLIGNAVHPGLGAEAARAALLFLQDKDVSDPTVNLEAAQRALRSCIDLAEVMADHQDTIFNNCMNELLQTKIKAISTRCNLLMNLIELSKTDEISEALLTRMYRDAEVVIPAPTVLGQ